MHWFLLVFAMHQLLQAKVNRADIQLANLCLRKFVIYTGELYGAEHMTYNLHLLIHLPEAVCNWGPLWATSAFGFENGIGVLKRLAHGTQ